MLVPLPVRCSCRQASQTGLQGAVVALHLSIGPGIPRRDGTVGNAQPRQILVHLAHKLPPPVRTDGTRYSITAHDLIVEEARYGVRVYGRKSARLCPLARATYSNYNVLVATGGNGQVGHTVNRPYGEWPGPFLRRQQIGGLSKPHLLSLPRVRALRHLDAVSHHPCPVVLPSHGLVELVTIGETQGG